MPFYDYKCSCGKMKEELHSSSSNPTIMCECGEEMKRAYTAGVGGFKLTTDSTRNRDYKTRYGGKFNKSDNTPTPSESAKIRAQKKMEERVEREKKEKETDPYSEFRD